MFPLFIIKEAFFMKMIAVEYVATDVNKIR